MSNLAFTESWSVWHANPFPQTYHFKVQRFALCYSLPVRSPPNGPDRVAPAIGDFYFRTSSKSVTLPAPRCDYNSD